MSDRLRCALLCACGVLVGIFGTRMVISADQAARLERLISLPAPPPAPTITVWLTKDLLGDQVTFSDAPRDDGIIAERRVPDPAPAEVLVIPWVSGNASSSRSYGPGEWHRTRAAAVARAEEMRAARLAELERKIEELKAMDFEEARP